MQIYQLRHKKTLGGARKMTAEGAFLKLVKEFLPFSLHFLPNVPLFLRLAEVLDDVADGLGREELGILALVVMPSFYLNVRTNGYQKAYF